MEDPSMNPWKAMELTPKSGRCVQTTSMKHEEETLYKKHRSFFCVSSLQKFTQIQAGFGHGLFVWTVSRLRLLRMSLNLRFNRLLASPEVWTQ